MAIFITFYMPLLCFHNSVYVVFPKRSSFQALISFSISILGLQAGLWDLPIWLF